MANTRIHGCCRERALEGAGLGRPSRLNQGQNDQDRDRKIAAEYCEGRYYRQSERSSEISRVMELTSTSSGIEPGPRSASRPRSVSRAWP